MANEAQILNLDGDIRQVTVPDGTAINKGTLLFLNTDPNTAAPHSTIEQIPLGFTVTAKAADDGRTTIGVRVRGDVDAIADGAITLGELVIPGDTANMVRAAKQGSAISGVTLQYIIGRCLETASDAERVRIRLMLG